MHPEDKKVTALVPVAEKGEQLPDVPAAKQESYWGRVSARYSKMTRVLIVVLLLAVVIFALIFSRMFTYDSLFSFVKDMQTVSSFVPANYDTVYAMYEGGESGVTLYRGSLAFVGSGGVEIYAPDGTRLLDVSRELVTPRSVASDKYLLAYDMGGKSFFVTNSYGELFAGESEFPILGAAVSDSGYFALITTSDTSISRVVLYDHNFRLLQGINRNSATVGIAFADDDTVAILSATAGGGSVYTAVDLYTAGRESADCSFSFENEMPLAIAFTEDAMMILTDRALRACDSDGEVENLVSYTGLPVDFGVADNGSVLVLETETVTATNRVLLLDEDGELLYDGTYTGDIIAAAVGENKVFLLCDGAVICLTPEKEPIVLPLDEAGATDILTVDEDTLRVIYPAKAVLVKFENS